MKSLPLVIILLLFASSLSQAQCRSSSTHIAIGTSGNEIFTDAQGRHLVGVSGVTLHYGKSRSSGFGYGLMLSRRKSSYFHTQEGFTRDARLIGMSVQQRIIGFGRWTLSPFGNVYLGRIRDTSAGIAAAQTVNVLAYRGAELGLELDFSFTCFLSAYGRSAVRYEQSIGKEVLNKSGVGTRPIAEVGVRIKV